jgi:uncharacterized protein YjbJ (UPF0337 family)
VDIMDKDRVKGTIDDAAGRAKRQVGEWTDNPDLQIEGAAQQVKGKTEKVVGKVKDAARDAGNDIKNAARDAGNRDRQDNSVSPGGNQNKNQYQSPGNFASKGQSSEQRQEH